MFIALELQIVDLFLLEFDTLESFSVNADLLAPEFIAMFCKHLIIIDTSIFHYLLIIFAL